MYWEFHEREDGRKKETPHALPPRPEQLQSRPFAGCSGRSHAVFHIASPSTEVNFKARAVKPFAPSLFCALQPRGSVLFGRQLRPAARSAILGRSGEAPLRAGRWAGSGFRRSLFPGRAGGRARIPRGGRQRGVPRGAARSGRVGSAGPAAGAAPPCSVSRRCPRCWTRTRPCYCRVPPARPGTGCSRSSLALRARATAALTHGLYVKHRFAPASDADSKINVKCHSAFSFGTGALPATQIFL